MRSVTRYLRRALLAVPWLAGLASASSVPDPLFVADPGNFTHHVDRGQFSELLEVHLTQYATDPAWEAAWAAGRYRRSGLLAQYGSISSRALLARLDLALNLPATETLLLRYDQRGWADTRFDLQEQRFDALWWAAPGFALMASGWPTPQKEAAAFGLGCALGGKTEGNQLVVLVRDDRYVFNQKTDADVHFTHQPLRLLLDGTFSGEAWQAYGSFHFGTVYAAEESAPGRAPRAASGRLQTGDAGILWRRGALQANLTGRFAVQERAEAVDGADTLWLDRERWRLDGALEWAPGLWGGALVGGYVQQRDRFFAAQDVTGEYLAHTALFGAEGIYRGWSAGEFRLGYVGSVFHHQRESTALGPAPPTLADDAERGYVDKAHLKGRYRLHPSLAVEALLAKEISRGSFGGFSVRVFGQL